VWPSQYPQAPGSLSVASYDSQGYGGGILTCLHAGALGIVTLCGLNAIPPRSLYPQVHLYLLPAPCLHICQKERRLSNGGRETFLPGCNFGGSRQHFTLTLPYICVLGRVPNGTRHSLS
jgi:hypothetical protein